MIESTHNKHVCYMPPGTLIEERTIEGGWYGFIGWWPILNRERSFN
jgi:hypothetical protein